MDSLVTAAARALASGDPLRALNLVALREDASALALRGIAMAQLGDYVRARQLLRQAARTFNRRESLSRARCIVAEAEVALASRDLARPPKTLDQARILLEAHGDHINAAHARYLEIRRLLLIGHLDAAEQLLAPLDPEPLPPVLQATHALAVAGIALRRLHIATARRALQKATCTAQASGIGALVAEVAKARELLHKPSVRLLQCTGQRELRLEEVEAVLNSSALVVDACRNVVRAEQTLISLTGRPILFALLRVLAEAWPGDVSRETLILHAFRTKHVDESHRARLRVEIGRLRKVLTAVAGIDATSRGFVLHAFGDRDVVTLVHATDEPHARVLALLADGEAWSSSSLAVALGESQRTVQRMLEILAGTGKITAVGQGRARRWMAPPLVNFTTTLLLPCSLALP